jgi:major membrane immunogen (membrane-anchored lipoprotein)
LRQAIRFIGGFAMAGDITPEEYLSTAPDPIAEFAEPIMVSVVSGATAECSETITARVALDQSAEFA